jgi:ABC-type transporter Mla subunit MlaD
MSDISHSEKESLSRIREILFGDQLASVEKRLQELADKQQQDVDKLIAEINTVANDAESFVNDKMDVLKNELLKEVKQVESEAVQKKDLAAFLRKLADEIYPDTVE